MNPIVYICVSWRQKTLSAKMKYWELINNQLKPSIDAGLNKSVLDLFAGCGGLSLGFEANGFKTIGYEMDASACETYNRNLLGPCEHIKLSVDFNFPTADIVIGGPPCQPFSVGGKQLGLQDARDGFPIFLAAIKKVQPEVLLFENVRGMMYKNSWYLKEILQELKRLGYFTDYALLNAVNYGVPQNRERLIVIGAKKPIRLPDGIAQHITAGAALGEMATQFDENSKFFTDSMNAYVAKYERASSCITPRDLHLDRPARTLTCRNLAGATGDMHRIKLPDGRRRRITIREAARLQSFPDWFEFSGTETKQFYQIGNAVPPNFAYYLARHVKNLLLNTDTVNAQTSDYAIASQLRLFDDENIYHR
jgi:DNA (cytosine-5)-methyltransferase 1